VKKTLNEKKKKLRVGAKFLPERRMEHLAEVNSDGSDGRAAPIDHTHPIIITRPAIRRNKLDLLTLGEEVNFPTQNIKKMKINRVPE